MADLAEQVLRLCEQVGRLQISADRLSSRIAAASPDEHFGQKPETWLTIATKALDPQRQPEAAEAAALIAVREAVARLEYAQNDLRACAARFDLILNSHDLRADFLEKQARFNRDHGER